MLETWDSTTSAIDPNTELADHDIAVCNGELFIELSTLSHEVQFGALLRGEVVIHSHQPIEARSLHVYLGFRIQGNEYTEQYPLNKKEIKFGKLSKGSHRLPFVIAVANSDPNEYIPLSYQGQNLSIIWAVSARLNIVRAVDLQASEDFIITAPHTKRLVDTPIESSDLNPADLMGATIFGVVFCSIIGVLLLLLWESSSVPLVFVIAISFFVLMFSFIMKATVPKSWHFKKLGNILLNVEDYDEQSGALSGRVVITPNSNITVESMSVTLVMTEQSEGQVESRRARFVKEEIIDSHTFSHTLRLYKTKRLSQPFKVNLPSEAMPSFALKESRITWSLHLQITSGGFELNENQNIEVKLAKRAQNNESLEIVDKVEGE